MSKFDDLVTKLREIFQIDRPELDFGVYRILNARADEINDYLSNRLKERVGEALATGAAADVEAQKRELDEAIKNAQNLGADPDTLPKVKELKAAITNATSGASEHENAVFSHLLTFFSRYYDKGDFISQRRYKGDTYAIPYAGEEVVLHWANKDQYYTKSGEAFSNYGFKLGANDPGGRSVQFRLIAADTAKDNRKDNDKERRFALAEARTLTRIDEEGEPYDEEIIPVSEEDGDLIIRFEYRSFPPKTKQETLVEQAVEIVLADEAVQARWQDLTNRAPTDKKPQRTLLEKHLTNYTQKNTADYFIHKDLGTFLRRELDFYIKNEVLHLDDVQNVESFATIEGNLRMIQCLRAIALDLITFLASIEDFQKKLWLKKKFVVAAHYCVTLDRVPEALYERIAANPAQWAQWHDLGMRGGAEPGSVNDLKADPYLMVDSALFDAAFRADLLKAIPDLDGSMDGLLVHGDNFQALTLLTERYREKVGCVYIDPPYNSAASEILYKNNYRDSSWLALIANRVEKSLGMMKDSAPLFVAIDDIEQPKLASALDEIFGPENKISTVAIMHNSKGRDQAYFSISHEYTLVYARNEKAATLNRLRLDEKQIADKYPKIKDGNRYRNLPLRRRGSESQREDRAYMYFPFVTDKEGNLQVLPRAEYERIYDGQKFDDEYVELLRKRYESEGLKFVLPIRDDNSLGRWRWGYDRCESACNKRIAYLTGNPATVYVHDFANPTFLPKSLWHDVRHDATTKGTNYLKNMLGKNPFDYPKSVWTVQDFVEIGSKPNDIIMDYFGGSGTTANSIINLQRETNFSRRYILIDSGLHFKTVLKRRTQKAVYSAGWKKAQPTTTETGISHAFKVLKIESYEDTLNNLTLARGEAQAALLDQMIDKARDDYMMRYMLDVEARGSILSLEDFKKPFDYMLNIAVDSAGAYERTSVDMIETFNYLIGLTVKTIDIQLKQGFATIEGSLPDGKRTLILWRDCDMVDYDALNKLCDKLAINPGDSEYDVVYINGDHNLPTRLQASEADGGAERELTIRQIEPVFLSAMFEVTDN